MQITKRADTYVAKSGLIFYNIYYKLTCSGSEWRVHRSRPWLFSLLQGILSVGHTACTEETKFIINNRHLNNTLLYNDAIYYYHRNDPNFIVNSKIVSSKQNPYT